MLPKDLTLLTPTRHQNHHPNATKSTSIHSHGSSVNPDLACCKCQQQQQQQRTPRALCDMLQIALIFPLIFVLNLIQLTKRDNPPRLTLLFVILHTNRIVSRCLSLHLTTLASRAQSPTEHTYSTNGSTCRYVYLRQGTKPTCRNSYM